MKYVSKDEQLKRAIRDSAEIKAGLKAQQAQTDYVVMMTGIDTKPKQEENSNDND